MAVEIKSEGYQDIKDYIEANWIWVELRDSTGTVWGRISTSDTRVAWTHSSGDQVLEVTISLRGDDDDITLPQEFAESVLYKVETGGDEFSANTFSATTLEENDDELTIKHQVQVPEVV